MWAITCIPLSGVGAHLELTYYSRTEITEGSVISIPLRKKAGFGLVLTCVPLQEKKQDLRASSFALRKLSDPKPRLLFSRAFLRAVFEASMELATPPGDLLSTLTPKPILEGRHLLKEFSEIEIPSGLPYEPMLFSQTHEERLSEYKRLAREALAREKSMLIIVPTIFEADTIGRSLQHNIKGYVEIVHSKISKKKLIETWGRASDESRPVVIVGTLQALSMARHDFSLIIFEREGARTYVHETRPYIHGKIAAEAVAKAYGARFILASTCPSIGAHYRKQKGDLSDVGLSLIRLAGPTPSILDLKSHKKERAGYDPLMPHSILSIQTALNEKKNILIIAARRGLAPQTICDDCGTILSCAHCASSLVLHDRGAARFLCHRCGREEAASVRCRKCQSWRLTPLGIAIDSVAHSLEKHFTDAPIFIVSQEESGKEEKLVNIWRETGGILVSTERIIPYLPEEIPLIVIASIDSFLGIPEYSAAERAFILLCELKSRAKESMVIQTRDPLHRVIKAMLDGSSQAYYKDELADRERFSYPPFATLVRITASGKKEKAQSQSLEIMKALEQFNPIQIDGRPNRSAEGRVHVLVRLKEGAWVDQRLLRFLRLLPPSLEVRINPLSVHTD